MYIYIRLGWDKQQVLLAALNFVKWAFLNGHFRGHLNKNIISVESLQVLLLRRGHRSLNEEPEA